MPHARGRQGGRKGGKAFQTHHQHHQRHHKTLFHRHDPPFPALPTLRRLRLYHPMGWENLSDVPTYPTISGKLAGPMSNTSEQQSQRTGRMHQKGEDIARLIRQAQRNTQLHSPPTPTDTPQTPPPPISPKSLQNGGHLRGKFKVAYWNRETWDAYTHTALEACKDFGLIFNFLGSTPGATQHPRFHRLTTNSTKRTRIVAFVSKKRSRNYHHTHHSTNAISVKIGGTNIAGVYLPPKQPLTQLMETLQAIPSSGKACILGDFNAHHTCYGSRKTNTRGEHVQDWQHRRNLIQRTPIDAITWSRGDKESPLDLVFTNDNTWYSAHPLHILAFLGSNQYLLAGSISNNTPHSHTNKVTDWTWLEEYAKEPPPYSPTTHEQAYSDLKDLRKYSRIETASIHSKKWWGRDLISSRYIRD